MLLFWGVDQGKRDASVGDGPMLQKKLVTWANQYGSVAKEEKEKRKDPSCPLRAAILTTFSTTSTAEAEFSRADTPIWRHSCNAWSVTFFLSAVMFLEMSPAPP